MTILEKFKGIKVLEVTDDYFLGSKGYQIFKYDFSLKKYDFFASVIDKYSFFSKYSLLRRFLRAEINGLYLQRKVYSIKIIILLFLERCFLYQEDLDL